MNLKFWTWNRKAVFNAIISSGMNGQASWPDRNYENFASEAYMKSVIAFACIDRIAKAVSMVPWELRKNSESNEVIYDHPFNNVLHRANVEESWVMFLYGSTSYLCMMGNSFMNKVGPTTGQSSGEIRELWNLRPDRVTIETDKETGMRTGYRYKYPSGKEDFYEIDPITGKSDILHVKLFHPLNDFWGMSPVEPAARKIDASNSMDEWNKKLLDNSGRPGMLYFFKETLEERQYNRLKEDLKKNVEGAANAGKSLILEGATDAKPYGFTPSEMDWINSNKEQARSICIAWGVPPQLIGIPDVSTYSNYQEARTAFYEDTVMFYLQLFQAEFNTGFINDESVQLKYNLDNVPAMQYKQAMKWDRAKTSDFMMENEKRKMVGLDEVDGGDVILKPANLIPLGFEDSTEDADKMKSALKKLGYSDSDVENLMSESW